MNILHVCYSDSFGGASRAAYRIHKSLVSHDDLPDLVSSMRVINKQSDDQTVFAGKVPTRVWVRYSRELKRQFNRRVLRDFKTRNQILHSPASIDSGLPTTPLFKQADLLHLHWLGFETLSIEEVGRLRTPLVWTLHDQWAFCGAEHYSDFNNEERFDVGYTSASRPAHESGPDLNRLTWLRKQRAWNKPIQIVCPSTWLAECTRRSALMSNWPISVIPNPIDLSRWAPVDQSQARSLLNLPKDRLLVLFGAFGGTRDPRKGAHLLFDAINQLSRGMAAKSLDHLEFVVFGQSQPTCPPDFGFPIHYFGHQYDDLSLRLLYAAADVFVIPSCQDNLPNTGLEAHACGTPVVAFRTGGLVDIVDDRVTGVLAEPFDSASLAEAIHWVLEDRMRSCQLGINARQRAERLWDPRRVAEMYSDLYLKVLENRAHDCE